MTSEIDKLKHFHIEDYSGTNFTDDLNDGEKFLYTKLELKLLLYLLLMVIVVVLLFGKLILFKDYVIGILLVLLNLLMMNGVK